MRVAILDLGTNTFHLLIADIVPGVLPVQVYQETIAVKLGEGGISAGVIGTEAFERGLQAIRKFRTEIDTYRPDEIRALATSAIRTAANGNDFIFRVKAAYGIPVELIDGHHEAELIYKGVRAAVKLDENALIMDIGGGSVEFIIGNSKELLWKGSYPVGAARLMDRFHHSDPISKKDIGYIRALLDDSLNELKKQLQNYQPEILIGSAGAFETFAAIQDPSYLVSFENPEYDLDINIFDQTYSMLISSSHDQRVRMETIVPVRTDMIVVAAVLTRYVLDISGIRKMKLSCYSLKEGVLFSGE